MRPPTAHTHIFNNIIYTHIQQHVFFLAILFFSQITIGERTVREANEEDQHGKRQVYAARAVTINAELKKRRLEVFVDEPGPSTVSAPVPHTAELFKPVEYFIKLVYKLIIILIF